jgi:hydrogenase expression/formation protein HypD
LKHLDEYRDRRAAERYAALLARLTTKPWTVMEVCGGQTHSIVRFGIDRLLPEGLELVHGPGCPVCVTPLELIDKAVEIALKPGVVLCSFGDMLRVPGSTKSLLQAKGEGAQVRIVYSPLDALDLARKDPSVEVVFFAVGFETTAPATAMAAQQALRLGVKNFSLLVSHVLVPPALEALMSSGKNRVQGFLAAGHVCAVMGTEEYEPIAEKRRVPIVVTGFEPVDILQGLCLLVRQLERGEHRVDNQYARVVRRGGNRPAIELLREVFEPCRRKWRGIGPIESSGLRFTARYAQLDAERRFGVAEREAQEPAECIAGLVLQGLKKPRECPAFAGRCTPESPLGAPMVSSEGACAAYYRYAREKVS